MFSTTTEVGHTASVCAEDTTAEEQSRMDQQMSTALHGKAIS